MLVSPQQVLDDLIGSADIDRWHVQYVFSRNTTPTSLTGELFGSLAPLLGKDRRYDRVQFQFMKAFSRGLADPMALG